LSCRAFPERTFDFVLTDPPYIVRYESRDGRRIEGDRNGDWLEKVYAETARVMKDNTYCVSFYGWSRVRSFMRAWDLAIQTPGILVRSCLNCESYGHTDPPQKGIYLATRVLEGTP
jgi:hypothetical protein